MWREYSKKAIQNTLNTLGYEDSEFYNNYFHNTWRYIAGHIDHTLFVPTDVIDNGAGKYVLMRTSDRSLDPYFIGQCKQIVSNNGSDESQEFQYINPECQAFNFSLSLTGAILIQVSSLML